MKARLSAVALIACVLSAPAAAVRWDQTEITTNDGGHIALAIDVDSVQADEKQVVVRARIRNTDSVAEEHMQILVQAHVCAAGAGYFGVYDLDGNIRVRPLVDRNNPRYWDILAAGACFARAGVLGLPEPETWFKPTRRAPAAATRPRNSF